MGLFSDTAAGVTLVSPVCRSIPTWMDLFGLWVLSLGEMGGSVCLPAIAKGQVGLK